MARRSCSWAILFALLALGSPAGLLGQAKKSEKSEDVVKVTADAGKPDADGKQIVTINLAMVGKWHVYANPVDNETLVNAKTTITITAKEKPSEVKVDYPPGKLIKDKDGDYKVYEDKVAIKAQVKRAKGDTGPLEVTIRFSACDDKQCLLPATVKLSVP